MATTLPDNNRMKLSGRSHGRAVAGEMVVAAVGQTLDGPATYPIGVMPPNPECIPEIGGAI
jgi:hypothetical protein